MLHVIHRRLHHRVSVESYTALTVTHPFYFANNSFCPQCPPSLLSQSLMELVKARKRLTEPEARYYTLQILSAIKA